MSPGEMSDSVACARCCDTVREEKAGDCDVWVVNRGRDLRPPLDDSQQA